MFQRLLASALIAGIAAGLIAALLHFAFVQRSIVLAEGYETGALTHFAAPLTGEAHAHDAPQAPAVASPAPPPAPDLQRGALTVLFMVILYVAYAFLLVAGFALAEVSGKRIGPQEGLLWGIAGFAAFHLAPAMGLAPELPGTIAAEAALRQIWWWTTVACTGTALALLAYLRRWPFAALAVALLALPHVIGAPQVSGFHGLAPPELGAMFSARVLGAALVVWACLGALAGAVWSREGGRPA